MTQLQPGWYDMTDGSRNYWSGDGWTLPLGDGVSAPTVVSEPVSDASLGPDEGESDQPSPVWDAATPEGDVSDQAHYNELMLRLLSHVAANTAATEKHARSIRVMVRLWWILTIVATVVVLFAVLGNN